MRFVSAEGRRKGGKRKEGCRLSCNGAFRPPPPHTAAFTLKKGKGKRSGKRKRKERFPHPQDAGAFPHLFQKARRRKEFRIWRPFSCKDVQFIMLGRKTPRKRISGVHGDMLFCCSFWEKNKKRERSKHLRSAPSLLVFLHFYCFRSFALTCLTVFLRSSMLSLPSRTRSVPDLPISCT